MGIALDEQYVYWTDDSSDGQLVRAPKSGGDPRPLAPSGMSWGIVVDASTIYWTIRELGELRSVGVPTRAGAFDTIAMTVEAPLALVEDEENLYWFADTQGFILPNVIMRMPKSGGMPAVLASGFGRPLGQLAVRDGFVIWTGPLGLHRVATSGGDVEVVHQGPAQALTIDDDGWIYFSAASPTRASPSVILRTPVSGGAIETVIAPNNRVSDIIVNDEWIFFAIGAFGLGYELWRMPKSGGDMSCIAKMRGLGSLAVDAKTLYWAQYLGGGGIIAFDLIDRAR